ncbi:hypothetical protein COU62_00425 [Candidatus Pacearchaeota archaeon CG10_big_fil_rev_8_21_14_0_10_35_219]|nr:hypothetical protein [Candidatus Pacearchaeota archaeon]OIO42719.1 MAG: hypothetical protein AUJ63_02300 [Candidatus Pacearchaeota archaeon CG1_02_35_32]PIO08255.1 MAG: hypothetical protein COU62_00425 [Candidatus Pacearchaeota archaeon CG10_big_fil_rev_8_21_14_0_10_35_219]PIY81856.1 MAG: hypothetical protein COY79_00165 [Candidatus Pacearchaeota archaeon CG_4_10_14_0_8_um_filter_35_169]PIZ79403.1 MAG: hypothetical protein COY00_04470 [Candidatus Pacearchaeota archaeon CG_4_10_14_0_2_um_filt
MADNRFNVDTDRPYETFHNGGIFPVDWEDKGVDYRGIGFVIDGKVECVQQIHPNLDGLEPGVAAKMPHYRIDVMNNFARRGFIIS